MEKVGIVLLSIILAFLTSCRSSRPGYAEWMVDGEYKALISGEQTVDKLMEYIQAEDVDSIYQVFSSKAKETSGNLREKIEELVNFINKEMISWEYDTGGPFHTEQENGKIMRNRVIEFFIRTDETEYICSLLDIMRDDFDSSNEGFCSITVVPKEATWLCRYGYFDGTGLGVFLSYPCQDKDYGETILKHLMDFYVNTYSDSIYELFSEYAKESVPDLPVQIESLAGFFEKPFHSWEFDSCVTEKMELPGTDDILLRRMTVFLLHTDNETYRLQIRDLVNEQKDEETLGLYSIAISTEQYAGTNRELGWVSPGIFIYQLTIEPDTAKVEGGGIVQFRTSIEAFVTCDVDDVILRKVDAFTWEATIPPENQSYIFTASAGDETVSCSVRNNSN